MSYSAGPLPPRPSSPRRTWAWLTGLVLALAVGLIIGRWVFPAEPAVPTGSSLSPGTPPAGTLGAPHGPSKIIKGVPSGYTRDKAGASTAATNVIQVMVAVAHGQADPDTVRTTWIASDASDGTRKALSDRQPSSEGDQTNKLPATTRVTDYSDATATVEVWVVSVGSNNGGVVTAARWTTTTVQLTWENDWKATSLRTVAGPEPGQIRPDAQPVPLTSGLYTFYIE